MKPLAPPIALALVLMTPPDVALAWSNDGHRITGYIAAALLTDVAREQVKELLGSDDLASLATVLDDDRDAFERRHRGASRWHYENRAVCGTSVSCPRGECVTKEIERFESILRDRGKSRAERAEALTVLVHLIGDLHQPLHLADNGDRGGNDLWVRLPRESEPRRLHEVWDYSLVRLNMNRRSARAYARALLEKSRPALHLAANGSIESWARETYSLGKQAYESLPAFACDQRANRNAIALPASYVQLSRGVVAEQLAKAGARIAFVLNAILRAEP